MTNITCCKYSILTGYISTIDDYFDTMHQYPTRKGDIKWAGLWYSDWKLLNYVLEGKLSVVQHCKYKFDLSVKKRKTLYSTRLKQWRSTKIIPEVLFKIKMYKWRKARGRF